MVQSLSLHTACPFMPQGRSAKSVSELYSRAYRTCHHTWSKQPRKALKSVSSGEWPRLGTRRATDQVNAGKRIGFPLSLAKQVHWRKTRKAALKRAGYRCQICGNREPLSVHHNNYESVGRERAKDVIAICESCHKVHHKSMELVKERISA